MRLLTRYLTAAFLSSYLVCLFFFLGLFLIIDLFQHVDDYFSARPMLAAEGYKLWPLVIQYYAARLPIFFLEVAPFVTLMGAMFALARLGRSNELVPVVTSGMSLQRFVAPLFIYGAMATLVMIVVQEAVVPPLAWRIKKIDRIIDGKNPDFLEKLDLMLDPNGNRVSFRRYDPVRKIAEDVVVWCFEGTSSTITADRATYREAPHPGWYLEGGVEHTFDEDGDPVEKPKDFLDTVDLVPAEVDLSTSDKATLSFSELNHLFHRTPEVNKLRVLLHHRLTFPASNLVLLLLGMPLVLNRNVRNLIVGVGLSALICGAFFATDFIAQDFGGRGTVHPVVATWFPTILFGSIGVVLFDSIKT